MAKMLCTKCKKEFLEIEQVYGIIVNHGTDKNKKYNVRCKECGYFTINKIKPHKG